jgi:malate dehydrogenase (oxaloacetate-decarboxylating)(NADP+)
MGRIYRSLGRIREVSAAIGAAVATVAFENGLAGVAEPESVLELVESTMWTPRYELHRVVPIAFGAELSQV